MITGAHGLGTITSFDSYPLYDYLKPGGHGLIIIGRIIYEKFVN